MKPHVIWAVAVYAIALLAGYTVLEATGHPGAAGGLAAGGIFAPIFLAFFGALFFD